MTRYRDRVHVPAMAPHSQVSIGYRVPTACPCKGRRNDSGKALFQKAFIDVEIRLLINRVSGQVGFVGKLVGGATTAETKIQIRSASGLGSRPSGYLGLRIRGGGSHLWNTLHSGYLAGLPRVSWCSGQRVLELPYGIGANLLSRCRHRELALLLLPLQDRCHPEKQTLLAPAKSRYWTKGEDRRSIFNGRRLA